MGFNKAIQNVLGGWGKMSKRYERKRKEERKGNKKKKGIPK